MQLGACLLPRLCYLLINNCVSLFLFLQPLMCLLTVIKILKATLHVKMSHLNKIKVLVNCSQWQQFDVNISRYARDDQVILESFPQPLPETGHRYYLRKASEESSDDFLLVHQTADQRRIMSMNGNAICLLDATYRTADTLCRCFLL